MNRRRMRCLSLACAAVSAACGSGKVATQNRPPAGDITVPAAASVTLAQGGSLEFEGSCTDPDGDPVTHLWTFGGAGPDSHQQNAGSVFFSSPGTFLVTYTCTDVHGLADPAPKTRTVQVVAAAQNHAPHGTIAAPAADATVVAGGSVDFQGACTDPDGDPVTHAWDFGGGAAARAQQSPGKVAFAAAGVYTATYTCTDSHGLPDPSPPTRQITVTAVAANHPPHGTITAPAANASIAPGGSVDFQGACADPDGDPVTHAWDFAGGAAPSAQQSPGSVTFAAAGVYVVTYTCTDSHGLADPAPPARTITVAAAGATRTLAGVITFDKVPATATGLAYSSAVKKPVRNAEVALVEAANLANVLAAGFTGEDGRYSLSWPATAPAAVQLIVYSRTHSPRMIVQDNTAANAVYALASTAIDATTVTAVDLHAAHGWNGTAYATRAASPFAVLDTAWQAVRAFQAVRPAVAFPELRANWSANNAPVDAQGAETQEEAYAAGHIGTSHWNGTQLYLLGQVDVDTDEFDDHVVAHEWGHYFETSLSRADNPGGSHGFADRKDARLAFSEGWGNSLSAMVWSPAAIYRDTYGAGQSNEFSIDLDDNSAKEDPNPGWYSEASCGAILYDLFNAGPDGVGLGLGPIYDVLTGAQKETPALTTLFSFISALKAAQPASAVAIDTLVGSRGVAGVPIADAYGTGETNNGGNANNLPLYRPLAPGVDTPITLSGPNGGGNELGQNRYFRFTGDGASHSVSIATPDARYDVDVQVLEKGVLKAIANGNTGTETTPATSFDQGVEYIIVVVGYAYQGSSSAAYATSVKIN